MMSTRRSVVTALCLGLVLAVTLSRLEGQQPNKDAAYCSAFVLHLKIPSDLKVLLTDGHTIRGRLIDATADEMEIYAERVFRGGVNRIVRYDAVAKV